MDWMYLFYFYWCFFNEAFNGNRRSILFRWKYVQKLCAGPCMHCIVRKGCSNIYTQQYAGHFYSMKLIARYNKTDRFYVMGSGLVRAGI